MKGYAGEILLTVGVDTSGAVTKAVITSQSETHGKAGMATYPDKFAGVAADKVAEVELFSGATVSSTAIKGAIIDAVNAATGGNISAPDGGTDTPSPIPMNRDIVELLELSSELVDGAESFEDVTPAYGKPETLLKLYKETGGKGYVAYVATRGEYVPVANEALVHIDLDGNIVAVNHLTWVVGHNVSAEGFADRFVGKDNWNVGEVELVTGATVTAGDLREAVAAAVKTVTYMLDRTDAKLGELMDRLVPNSDGFTKLEIASGAPDSLKGVYKENTGKGYVAHLVTPGEYVAVATESLVYYSTEGVIKDVMLLVWNVGHGVEPGSFAEGFIGKTKDTVGEVELVTSATYTASDMKDAIAASFDFVPTDFPTARVIGIVLAVLAAVAAVGFAVVTKIKRRTRV